MKTPLDELPLTEEALSASFREYLDQALRLGQELAEAREGGSREGGKAQSWRKASDLLDSLSCRVQLMMWVLAFWESRQLAAERGNSNH